MAFSAQTTTQTFEKQVPGFNQGRLHVPCEQFVVIF